MNKIIKYFCMGLLLSLNTQAIAQYTKVANNGVALNDTVNLGANADDWACTYDSSTKLIWEVKAVDSSLRSPFSSYTWYNSNSATNGNNAGTANGGNCADKGNCDTEKFVQRVNRTGLCAANDWRLPTLAELKTLIDKQYQPAINPVFFPDIKAINSALLSRLPVTGFWSSTVTNLTPISPTLLLNPSILVNPLIISKATTLPPSKAWYVSYEQATSIYEAKSVPHLVRLVRDAPKFVVPVNPTVPTTQTTPVDTTPTTPVETTPDTPSTRITPVLTSELWREEFNNATSPGSASGISYEKTPLGRGARFSRASKSRVEYPFKLGLPATGTLEFRLNIDSAYQYINGQLNLNQNCAIIFKTLAEGDYIQPGSAKLSVCKNGDVSVSIETQFGGDGPTQILSAKNTAFRFGEWHIVSFSYGKNGQSLSIDNQIMAEAPQNTQEILAGSSTNAPSTTPTLGQAVPVDPQNMQYDGFDGIVDTFRASKASTDWLLGKDYPKPTNQLAVGSFSEPNNSLMQATPILINDVPQQHVFNAIDDEDWFTFYVKPGIRYTIDIPDSSVGQAIAPKLELYDGEGKLLASGVDGILGFGQQLLFTGTGIGNQVLILRVINSNASVCTTNPSGITVIDAKKLYPKGAECSNTDLTANSYQLRIFLTDQPQQGIIKGFVFNECVHNGINEAEVSSLLGGIVNDSTLTHNTGQFGLPLNPDNYQIRSIASNYLDKIIGPVAVGLDDITAIQLEQQPLSGCASYQAPVIDLTLQAQQAVAIYYPEQNLLVVRDVFADGKIFYVELHDIGGLHFQLDRVTEIFNTLHTPSGFYDIHTLLADLPTVFAFNSTWRVQLKNDGNWIFTLNDYSKLY